MNGVRTLLEKRVPGLYAAIGTLLLEAEARYNRKSGQAQSQFLLEHAWRTAAIAHRLALLEGVEPFLPTLVALFHDAGKFHEGEYHKDGVPEEEHAAVLAGRMLAEFAVAPGEIEAALGALRALYDERLPCAGACRIVQDADRLDKLGTLGVGAFFTKAALRGRGLVDALVNALSREMTYALAAPHSMFTASGKKLAAKKAAKSIAFFEDLIEDLESWGIVSFDRRTIVLEEEFRTRDGATLNRMEVTIVMPSACPDCAAPLALTHSRERGLKCEKLTARFACGGCDYIRENAFCLPVFA